MKDFVVFMNEELFDIMDLGELTEIYHKDKSFRKHFYNGNLNIYIKDNRKAEAMINVQDGLNRMTLKLRKKYQEEDKEWKLFE